MSTTPDFLTTLPFLSDPVREKLRALGLDAPEAVVVFSASEIAAMLSDHAAAAGIAGRLLHAARAALLTPGRPSLTPTLERAQRAPSREVAAELRAAGVAFVVLGADDKLEPAGTDALTEHLAAGAPMPPTWQGRRIVPTDEICNPPVFCNPRTGTPLQAGQDELSEVRWGELGRDGLRVAAFGYSEGMFDGMSEAAVFVALTQDTKTRDRVVARAKARNVELATMDRRVILREPTTHGDPPPILRDGPSLREPMPHAPQSASSTQDLEGLLMSLFNADELRRFVRHGQDGERIEAALPNVNASLTTLAQAACEQWLKHGELDRTLMERLIAARDRRANEIRRVFRAHGVY